MSASEFIYDDGGREKAGYKSNTGDCVCRSISIATELPYLDIYSKLAHGMEALGFERTARKGVSRKVYQPFLEELGWIWVPTMKIGSGCKVHLRSDELPKGRLIVRITRHMTCVIDGKIHDIFDPSRDGTRCVYGYFSKPQTVVTAADHD